MLTASLTTRGCNNIVISWLYLTYWNKFATSLIVSTRLLQVVNSLFQTCWQLGTSSENTTCWRFVGRLATRCESFAYTVFTRLSAAPDWAPHLKLWKIKERRGAQTSKYGNRTYHLLVHRSIPLYIEHHWYTLLPEWLSGQRLPSWLVWRRSLREDCLPKQSKAQWNYPYAIPCSQKTWKGYAQNY